MEATENRTSPKKQTPKNISKNKTS